MTETALTDDSRVAAFMRRAATAYGRFETAPDPTVILLRAALVRRMEKERRALRLQTLSFAFTVLAATVAVLVAYRWVAPSLTTLGDAGLIAGISVISVVSLVWLFGIRPLSHAR